MSAGTISIDSNKVNEIHQECICWLNLKKVTKNQPQALLGRLLYVAKCVAPARIFLGRMLEVLRANHSRQYFILPQHFYNDLLWFVTYLRQFNGIVIYARVQSYIHVYVDSSLTGAGGVCGVMVYAVKIPEMTYPNVTIVHLEMINVLVAVRLWAKNFQDARVQLHCDNAAVVAVLNAHKTKDFLLSAILRNIWLITAMKNIEFLATHISGKNNTIADVLSRWYHDNVSQAAKHIIDDSFIWCYPRQSLFNINWDI